MSGIPKSSQLQYRKADVISEEVTLKITPLGVIPRGGAHIVWLFAFL